MVLHRKPGGRPIALTLSVPLSLLLLSGTLGAQQAPPEAQVLTLRVTTKLVLVDVTVTDAKGKLVMGLKPEDFTVLENGVAQKVSTFTLEEAQQAGAAPAKEPPLLPPHVYTNRPEYRAQSGSLTVVLLDSLNTPLPDLAWAQHGISEYLKTRDHLGQKMAVFALGRSLTLLQDFTVDGAVLRKVIQNYQPQSLGLIEKEDIDRCLPPVSRSPDRPTYQMARRSLRESCTRRADDTRGQRVAMTLAAMRVVSRALAGFPSRKSLLWVSASFPLVVTAAQDSHRKLPSVSYSDPLRQTASLMADARIAVYPVDARGMVGASIMSASDPGIDPMSGHVRLGEAFGTQIASAGATLTATQDTMDQLATETGGRVFKNTNDLGGAVESSLADASYYLLGYYPKDKNWNGNFRRVDVKLSRTGLRIRHRHGYYAIDPVLPAGSAKGEDELQGTLGMNGAPAATMVLFDAKVIPPDRAQGAAKMEVEFMVDPRSLSADEAPDGSLRFALEFHVMASTAAGKIAFGANTQTTTTVLPGNIVAMERDGLPYKTELELAPGEYQLHLAVRDVRTGAFGTLDAPLTLEGPARTGSH
jgi:VWFA-related protein